MPNNYFQFKKFIICQDKCSMKVCTDSCLFGAWIADKLAKGNITADTILDIGTGTGLLSLMLAQKSDAIIDAVETDEPAFEQALENINASPWKNTIHIFHSDAKYFKPGKTYDLVISNPPFYENELPSPDIQRNVSMHSEMLNIDELFEITLPLLSNNGYLAVLLPFYRSNLGEQVASGNGLYLIEKTFVRQSERHNFFRSMMIFQKEKPEDIIINEISIKDNGNAYTKEFTGLLEEYYLYL